MPPLAKLDCQADQAGSQDSQIRQNPAAPPQSVKSIKGTATTFVEAQLCQGFAKHSKNIGGSKLLELCILRLTAIYVKSVNTYHNCDS